MEHDYDISWSMARKDIQENKWFGNANRINSVKSSAAALNLSEKYDHQLFHLFIFGDVYGHDFGTVLVTTSKHFVFLHITR